MSKTATIKDTASLTRLAQHLVSRENGEQMKGVIRPISRQAKCPKCGEKFLHIPKLGYGCPDCETKPERFRIDLHLKGDKLTGKQGKRVFICSDTSGLPLDTYGRALDLQAHIQHEIHTGTFDHTKYVASDKKKYHVLKLLDIFHTAKLKGIAPSYRSAYKSMVDRHIEYFSANGDASDVRDIKKKNLLAYLEWLTTQPNKKNGGVLNSKTIINIYNNFKTFIKWLKEREEILDKLPNFPTDDEINEVLDSVVAEEQPFQYTWFTAEDQLKMLEVLEHPEDREFLKFLFLHPVRPGEARALQLSQVDTKTWVININATMSKNIRRNRRKGKKSKAYTLPVNPEMLPEIREKVMANAFNKESYLFLNPRTGKPYTHDALYKMFKKIRKRLGMPDHVRLYDATRHSGISQLLNNGGNILFASYLAGHSSTKMTEQVYGHVHLEALRTELSKLSLNRSKTIKLTHKFH